MSELVRLAGRVARFVDHTSPRRPGASLEPFPNWTEGLALVDPALLDLDAGLLSRYPGPWWGRYRALPLAQLDRALVVGFHETIEARACTDIEQALEMEVLPVQLGSGGGALPSCAALRASSGPRPAAAFRLRSTRIQVRLLGPLAEVVVCQRYDNPGVESARYRHPIGAGASLVEFSLHPQGVHEILQHGTDVELRLYRLEAGGPVETRLRYLEEVPRDRHGFYLRLPLPADEDADLDLSVWLERCDDPESQLACTRPASWKRRDAHGVWIRLERPPTGGPRPETPLEFVLRYHGGGEPHRQLFSDGRHFLLHLQAPDPPVSPPRDLLILLDRSQSLDAAALDRNRRACEELLRNLETEDRFALVAFDDRLLGWRQAELQSAGQRGAARTWLHQSYCEGGGSDFRPALEWLRRQGGERESYALVISDGRFGHLQSLFQAMRSWRGPVRLFCLAQGGWEGRQVLETLARLGGGGCREMFSPEADARQLLRQLAAPVLSGARLVGQGFHSDAEQQEPAQIPALFPSQGLCVFGRHDGEGKAFVQACAGENALPQALTKIVSDHPALGALWARARIQHKLLALQAVRGQRGRERLWQEIHELLRGYRLPARQFLGPGSETWQRRPPTVREGQESAAARLLHWIVQRAIEQQASHIHLDLQEHQARVRFRIHGRLDLVLTPTPALFHGLMHQLDEATGLQPLPSGIANGRFRYFQAGQPYGLEVTVCPTVNGRTAVLEIRPQRSHDHERLAEPLRGYLAELLEQERGLLVVCAAPGTGLNALLADWLWRCGGRSRALIHKEEWQGLEGVAQFRPGAQNEPLPYQVVARTRVLGPQEWQSMERQVRRPALALARHPAASATQAWNDLEPTRSRLGQAFLGVLGVRRLPYLCSCRVPERDAGLLARLPEGDYRRPAGCPQCYYTGFAGSLLLAEWLDGATGPGFPGLDQQLIGLARSGRIEARHLL